MVARVSGSVAVALAESDLDLLKFERVAVPELEGVRDVVTDVDADSRIFDTVAARELVVVLEPAGPDADGVLLNVPDGEWRSNDRLSDVEADKSE